MAELIKDIPVSGANQALNLPLQKPWLQQTRWKKATDMMKSF